MDRQPLIYIVTNKPDGILYTGVTANAAHREWQRLEKLHPDSFTARHGLTTLVYYELFDTMPLAIAREKAIKNMSRARKVRLILKLNPSWSDLGGKLVG